MKRNPVFWLMWILPGTAVVASFATLAIALQDADRALPAIYHWEGEKLDADFERARNASRHGMRATLAVAGGAQPCTVTVTPAPGDPASVTLSLTSARDASLDRTWTMQRVQAGVYRVACDALPRGNWRVALQDPAGAWALRGSLDDQDQAAVLEARDPEGEGA
jgi:hypothetical protein